MTRGNSRSIYDSRSILYDCTYEIVATSTMMTQLSQMIVTPPLLRQNNNAESA